MQEDYSSIINTFQSKEDLQNGAIVLINKNLEWTSFDVVNKMRWLIKRHLKIKKIKVGHAGTLDPLATGLLVICIGRMTKQIQYLLSEDKSYTGTFVLGQTTPSYDLETEPTEALSIEHITETQIHKTAESFIGEQKQQPPLFSAKKIDGVRAYELARKGEDVELKFNDIRIDRFRIDRIDMPEVDFDISSSKGTYIRSIANDFGKKLECGAYLKKLHRTQSGDFHISNAISIKDFENKLREIKELS